MDNLEHFLAQVWFVILGSVFISVRHVRRF